VEVKVFDQYVSKTAPSTVVDSKALAKVKRYVVITLALMVIVVLALDYTLTQVRGGPVMAWLALIGCALLVLFWLILMRVTRKMEASRLESLICKVM
jgi:hypothetical protein